ncbi:MAG: ATP-dependent DNA helicase RecG [Candidatus Edwardsbacteria bacterium RIFOXYD12_FULL_50_11]|uniref:ATP-dependent DNA helicase RecG n=1 Tax=Candidatus Edwardsbacteria bacterium GWF2_54_11 TaxID=1817851 RepID=A0A1F5R7F4_9BACT|nr:MAG: ATP-dependent DNA helicase RecG [Candidatus Edwardsbacteria bacterium RifOxyC12_full_54_24]OGF08291.1 MAG: ATP-dependent DNA helicase RecG [Candidatus Edwardsbacteria bacterium RifOxyA12_full_54_48]OGF10339.1 MAG: ATP-dependent DNA helicase RecG [Candidatus Edwardsbacteria bacterium GWF2_54_11]OGF11588.1 MAG: ATP-dependent DNA helicase RecG [Candidatus Edwardsbacteria bacterium GWE2_54_12]OGF17758.1 MAG: ATP-dependent DNA helicase RecG [Candidatus Edwardsbacteria bacterium RIFOXYD12_FUL
MPETNIQYLKGVGPKRALLFNKLGIVSVRDLLYYPPRRYLDRSLIKNIRDIRVGDNVTLFGQVSDKGLVHTRRNFTIFNLLVSDDTGYLLCKWFNQPYLKDRFQIGDRIVVSGLVLSDHGLSMANPEYELLDSEDAELIHTGRIVPLHPATGGLSAKQIRQVIKSALEGYLQQIAEPLPPELIMAKDLMGIRQAISQLHFPDAPEILEQAHRRLAFEELLYLELILFLKKNALQIHGVGAKINSSDWKNDFSSLLPFTLTGAQIRVIGEISNDIGQTRPMHRLLQGDVGSGKTMVALAAMIQAVRGGTQASLMAPTELLAEQHYNFLHPWFDRLGMTSALLTSKIKSKQRAEIYQGLSDGRLNVCVGTQALVQESVEFANLGLAIIDEQHRFGVRQRADFRFKGKHPHTLVMTATPIPRTLAITVYGDLDVSTIDQMPQGRRSITTKWTAEANRSKVYDFIEQQLEQGRQAYVVYPVIEESDKTELKAAIKMHRTLSQDYFKGRRVGLMHGQLPTEDRQAVMEDFRDHRIDILVSTTVIEVGIDVPNANVMFIEQAERFGLSQLHQLRGRVGRGSHKSYCILMAGPKLTLEARLRLDTMQSLSDGFKIAEKDLELRGPGEFWSTRQHGLPQLKIADLSRDADLIAPAREEAKNILAGDPDLSKENHRGIKAGLQAFHPEADKFTAIG